LLIGSSCVDMTSIILLGGQGDSGGPVNLADRYDVDSNSWAGGVPGMKHPRTSAAGVLLPVRAELHSYISLTITEWMRTRLWWLGNARCCVELRALRPNSTRLVSGPSTRL